MLPPNMFGMGMTEILVILLVAALFLGPEKLPEAATKISKGIRDLRRQQRDLQDTIENDTQIGGAIRDLKSALRGDEIRRPPVLKKPAKAEAVAAAALAGTDAAALPDATGAPDAPPAASTEHDLVTDPPTEAAPEAAGAQLATTTSPAAEAAADPPAAAHATSSTPVVLSVPATLTLAPTVGDPDRDHAPDDDDDEQAELARLVRPAPGAVKRDDHGST